MPELSKVKKIYFIGIGGIGMSAVAGIAKDKNFIVSGSDENIYQPSKGVLDYFQVPYKIGYRAENFINADLNQDDLVVVMSAIEESNPELQAAQAKGLAITSYAQLLGELSKDKRKIVVVGANGKGTTAGLLGYILKNINDSSFFVGAVLSQLKTNFYYGLGHDFVIEGDEYKAGYNDPAAKFLYYDPDILLINNIEWDHPDIYKSFEQFKAVFEKLISKLRPGTTVVYNADDKNVVEVLAKFEQAPFKKIGFGFVNKKAEISASFPEPNEQGVFISKAHYLGKEFVFSSNLPGVLYGYNNLAAISALLAAGYQPEQFIELLGQYKGLRRRFEITHDGDITLIEDYAHHPTAVRSTLEAARLKYPNRRIVCFFQPHTYSRTKEKIDELAEAFTAADLVFISEVYPAREIKLPESVTGKEVVRRIAEHQKNVFYVADQEQAKQQFHAHVKKGDVVLIMSVPPYSVQ